MQELLILIVIILLIAACGVFVAAEFSFLTVNRQTVDRLASKGDTGAKGIAHGLTTLSTQLSGAQVGITITNLAIGFLTEPVTSALLEPLLLAFNVPESAITPIAIIVGTTIATLVTMLFGELIPKNLAISKPLATAKKVQRFQRLFTKFMRYPIVILNESANYVLRRLGVTPQEELAFARTGQELVSIVRRSAEKGTLPKKTAEMIERSLLFDDLTAIDIMTPRFKMHVLGTNDTAQDVITLAINTGYSRYPVVGKNRDDIVGMVHIKQAVAVKKNLRATTLVNSIMQNPIVVPSSMRLDTLLNTLKSGGLQAAIVIDEFGGTDGIVTIEDLIEELVGEVEDEHDNNDGLIQKRNSHSWILSGLLRPDEIGEEIGIFLPEEDDFDTVGGLMADRLERVPSIGDAVILPCVNRSGGIINVRLVVREMQGRRAAKLTLSINKNEASL